MHHVIHIVTRMGDTHPRMPRRDTRVHGQVQCQVRGSWDEKGDGKAHDAWETAAESAGGWVRREKAMSLLMECGAGRGKRETEERRHRIRREAGEG